MNSCLVPQELSFQLVKKMITNQCHYMAHHPLRSAELVLQLSALFVVSICSTTHLSAPPASRILARFVFPIQGFATFRFGRLGCCVGNVISCSGFYAGFVRTTRGQVLLPWGVIDDVCVKVVAVVVVVVVVVVG